MKLKEEKGFPFEIAARGLSHDLNNVLFVISGNTELAMQYLKKEDQKKQLEESLKIIKKSTEIAASLNQRILYFSRDKVYDPDITDLNKIIQESVKHLSRGIIDKNINIISDLRSSKNINADYIQIYQMVINLGVNARDAMPLGGELRFSTENRSLYQPKRTIDSIIPRGDYVFFSVSDTGTGVKEKNLLKIFDRGYTTKLEGNGFGLSTVDQIIKNHEAYRDVKTEFRKGTKFEIYFPV